MQGDVFFLASTEDDQYEEFMNFIRQVYANDLYDGMHFSSPFVTPNHKYPFSMRSFLKDMRVIADEHDKMLTISMDGTSNKPDQKIGKKKAREIIDLVDKLVITNYDYPNGN